MATTLKNGMLEGKPFAGTTTWVISVKNGRTDSNGNGNPCLYQNISDAEYVMSQMSASAARDRTIRQPTADELARGVLVQPKRKVRGVCLVEIFEDIPRRRFAISSRSDNEAEFLTEFSRAFSAMERLEEEELQIRVRELVSLSVDLCCKYRGYKSDRVQEKRVLVVGDLEIPSPEIGKE